jgi:alanine racemase
MSQAEGPRFRPTRVQVDLDAIRHNVGALRTLGPQVMAVVKANAYGHGDVPVARAALEAGASRLGVATAEEGLRLRLGGVEAPILVLSEVPPGSEQIAIAHRLTPTLYTDEGLARLAGAVPGGVPVHVKVDTGMHRVGVHPHERTVPFLEAVVASGLSVEGLWTHLARSEDDETTTKEQLALFVSIVDDARSAGVEPEMLHAANSAAAILHPDTRLDLIRPGIAVYGIEPAPGIGDELGLRPALTWRSAVTLVKRLGRGDRISYGHSYSIAADSWVATIPAGYADGYPRALSSKADVIVGGRRCRVAGNVTMDQLMIDCGGFEPAPGDEVVLLGRQGDEEVTAWELAGHAGTIAYEIVSRIGERVPREHLGVAR